MSYSKGSEEILMKKAIFVILMLMILLFGGCTDGTGESVSATEKPTVKATQNNAEQTTNKSTTKPADTTEPVTEKIKSLPLAKNHQKDYIYLRNTGIMGDKLYYSSDYLWEYCSNNITCELSEEVKGYVGKFFVLNDDIYFTPSYSEDTKSSVQLWKIKADGTSATFVADDLEVKMNCVYVGGYILYNCYSEYYQSNFGLMAINVETGEKTNYSGVSNIQYTYNDIAYFLDGNHIKYFNPKTGKIGIVRNTGGSLVCGDSHYLYYISSGNGGLFRIDLNNTNYSANEFVKSGVSTFCTVINGKVYYYPKNTQTTSHIMVYDIEKAKDLSPINIGMTRKVYRLWSENGYLLFSVHSGKEDLNMSDYIINPESKKINKISNYTTDITVEQMTQPYYD